MAVFVYCVLLPLTRLRRNRCYALRAVAAAYKRQNSRDFGSAQRLSAVRDRYRSNNARAQILGDATQNEASVL